MSAVRVNNIVTYIQVEFNPRRLPGYGLTDGEGIERLWSYMRPFGPITKEMTPSHRTDLLTDALLHFAYRKKQCVGMTDLVFLLLVIFQE